MIYIIFTLLTPFLCPVDGILCVHGVNIKKHCYPGRDHSHVFLCFFKMLTPWTRKILCANSLTRIWSGEISALKPCRQNTVHSITVTGHYILGVKRWGLYTIHALTYFWRMWLRMTHLTSTVFHIIADQCFCFLHHQTQLCICVYNTVIHTDLPYRSKCRCHYSPTETQDS